MPIVIQCSACQRQLQVHETSLGHRVRCPFCTAVFTALAGTGNGPAPAAPPAPENPAPPAEPEAPSEHGFQLPVPDDEQADILRGWRRRIERQRQVRPLVVPPATALLAIGILGVIANAFFILRTMLLFMNAPAGDPVSPDRGLLAFVGFTGCAFLSGAVIYGASELLAMRSSYTLAIGTSVLAMAIVCPGCFLVGVPVGVWAIRTLKQPEVRSAFRD